jgi:hypothetical protein
MRENKSDLSKVTCSLYVEDNMLIWVYRYNSQTGFSFEYSSQGVVSST